MALVRKKNPEWKPSENRGLLVGETIEMDDFRRLVELGDVDLVDEQGNILPLPGTVFVCGICFEKIDSHGRYVDHIMEAHADKSRAAIAKAEDEEKAPAEPEEEFNIAKEFGKEAKKKAFAEKMAKARAAAKAKREEVKNA